MISNGLPAAGENLGDLVMSVRSYTQLLDAQGLLCICPGAIMRPMDRPWRFHPDETPVYQATVRTVPSKKAVAKISQNDAQYCLELWARLHLLLCIYALWVSTPTDSTRPEDLNVRSQQCDRCSHPASDSVCCCSGSIKEF